MYAIGIDMSKDTFHACFEGEIVRKFNNTDEGIEQFMSYLEEHGWLSGKTQIGMEATGAYHLNLAMTLKYHEWDVLIMNPLESHNIITSGIRTVKTDKADAIVIRDMVVLGKGYLFRDTEETIALKALVVERGALIAMRKQTLQRIEAHRLKAEACEIPFHDSFCNVLDVLSESIETIESRMKEYDTQTQKLLQSIPGVGPISAAALIAYVEDIERFSSPKKLVAYVGCDPRVYQSGSSVRGKGYISKRGNKYLRCLLFNAALSAKRHNSELTAYYEKKLSEGKHHFQALCAVERKLIHIIYAVWTRKTPFERR